MAKPAPISADEKRQAMERVLTSRSLGKSEQLRSFLRYVCEAELEGRAEEINEYALGVVALRRPKEYSPAEDSSVRSRAYELRNRLRAYYETEAPNDPIRIEIPKGGYVPRFLRSPGLAARNDAALASDFRAWTPELRSFWEPFLNSDAPLLIVFEVRLFFFGPSSGLVVRDYQTNDSADLAESRPLAMFRERMEEKELLETLDYTDVGTVHSAFLLGRLLSGTRLSVGLKHSASLDWEDLWVVAAAPRCPRCRRCQPPPVEPPAPPVDSAPSLPPVPPEQSVF